MLILRRKARESIIIDGSIRVTIQSIDAAGVSVSVEAPREVTVNREEVQLLIDSGAGQQPSPKLKEQE